MSDTLDPSRFGPTPTLTGPQAAAAAGLEYEVSQRIWRALGFPDMEEDVIFFRDDDVEALRAIVAVTKQGIGLEDVVVVARVYGTALSAVADAEAHLFRHRLVKPLASQGASAKEIEDALVPTVEWLLSTSAGLLDHVHRRRLAVAVEGVTVTDAGDTSQELAIGFVDLVGFTTLSGSLAPEELGYLVGTFEDVSLESSAEHGVRLVKMIGDAVMLMSPRPRDLLETARSIVRTARDHDVLPPARAGLDHGPTTPLAGDYFGQPVNTAARITSFARSDTVVVSETFLEATEPQPPAKKIGTRRLKGIGNVRLFKIDLDDHAEVASQDGS